MFWILFPKIRRGGPNNHGVQPVLFPEDGAQVAVFCFAFGHLLIWTGGPSGRLKNPEFLFSFGVFSKI